MSILNDNARVIIRSARKMVFDPVASALLDKLVVLAKGPLTIMAILYYLSPEEQGVWYTFTSLATLVALSELGFTNIISQFISHEYANISIRRGFIVGKKSSLDKAYSLVWYALKIYLIVLPCAVVIMMLIGSYILSGSSAKDVLLPWILYCISSGAVLLVSLFQAFYKGFDRVYRANVTRILANVVFMVSAVVGLKINLGLYALPFATAMCSLGAVLALYLIDPRFWVQLIRNKIAKHYSWYKEVISIQFRYALSWLSGYLMFNLYVPLAYKFQDAVVAGKLGLSLTLIKVISSLSYVWVESKLPQINILAARRERDVLWVYYRHCAFRALATFILAGISAYFILKLFGGVGDISNRILDFKTLIVIYISELAILLFTLTAMLIRAHKMEPYHKISMVSATLVASFVWFGMPKISIQNIFFCVGLFYWFLLLPGFLFISARAISSYYHGGVSKVSA